MSQDIPEHNVKVGQIRTWHFEGERTPSYNGASFLVTEVDGVRAEITGDGPHSSYYIVWLANNSEILIETDKNCK
jgi:hypothetical protein